MSNKEVGWIEYVMMTAFVGAVTLMWYGWWGDEIAGLSVWVNMVWASAAHLNPHVVETYKAGHTIGQAMGAVIAVMIFCLLLSERYRRRSH